MARRRNVQIVIVLDRSGSMAGIIEETVGALNSFITDQKKIPGRAQVTLVAFDNIYEKILDKVPLKTVEEIPVNSIPARGMTALNDAIGRTIAGIGSDDVVMLIMTDGHENASQEYKSPQIKEMIEAKQKAGWDISFIGAGIDAFEIGKDLGFWIHKTMNISKTPQGINQLRDYYTATSTSFRSGN